MQIHNIEQLLKAVALVSAVIAAIRKK